MKKLFKKIKLLKNKLKYKKALDKVVEDQNIEVQEYEANYSTFSGLYDPSIWLLNNKTKLKGLCISEIDDIFFERIDRCKNNHTSILFRSNRDDYFKHINIHAKGGDQLYWYSVILESCIYYMRNVYRQYSSQDINKDLYINSLRNFIPTKYIENYSYLKTPIEINYLDTAGYPDLIKYFNGVNKKANMFMIGFDCIIGYGDSLYNNVNTCVVTLYSNNALLENLKSYLNILSSDRFEDYSIISVSFESLFKNRDKIAEFIEDQNLYNFDIDWVLRYISGYCAKYENK